MMKSNENQYDSAPIDQQAGWNTGLCLVHDLFRELFWQKGLVEIRELTATELQQTANYALQLECSDYKQAMKSYIQPFLKLLGGFAQPEPPIQIRSSKNQAKAINCALTVLLQSFESFFPGRGPASGNWTWEEVADDVINLVEFRCRGKSQAYRQAVSDVVRPFCRVLKG